MVIKPITKAKVYGVFPGSSVLTPMFRGKEVEIKDIGFVMGIPVGIVYDKKYGKYAVMKINRKWIYER